jgi:osmotically-inducible protein OsmY
VNTREGIVQLGGFVDTSAAKTAAAEVAGSIDGVESVQNRLNVRN